MDTNEVEIIENEHTDKTEDERSRSTSIVRFDPLQQYFAQIKKYQLLTIEEERRLAIQYREKGDIDAAYKLITSNLRLVVHIALEFQRYWMTNFLDLVQEGNVGLMQAVRKFDPYKGVKLSYYASFWIKAYILKFIIDNWRLVKIGTTQSQRKLFFNLEKERRKLDALGYDPTPKLLGERLDVKEKEVIEMDQRLGGWDVSLESPISSDTKTTHKDFLVSEDVSLDDMLAESELRDIYLAKLEEFSKTLKGKEEYIFKERLLSDSPLSLQNIGDKFGLSKERIRQIEKRLIGKIRRFLKEEIPDFNKSYFMFED
jgi:RNA polymerase sigma-32 factor